MIALEVSHNGKRVCVAGAENLGVLTAVVSAVGKLGRKTLRARLNEAPEGIHFSVHGFTAPRSPDKDAVLRWKPGVPLHVGDVIQVRILETRKADRATSSQRARRRPVEQPGFRQRRPRARVDKRKPVTRRA